MPAQWPLNRITKAARAASGGGFESAITVVPTSTPLDAGLLWADGVEPTSSTLFPVDAGNRIWYVDFDAVTDGDGSELSPYNNLTHFGYFDGVSFQGPDNAYTAGDHIWVTGTATAAKHVNGTSNMNWNMTDEALLGTAANPTVIRSWKGKSRAKFDGEFSKNLGFRFEPTTDTVSTGVVILNIETTRNTGMAISIGQNVNFSRTVSCWAHLNQAIAGGPSSSYGGIVVRTNSPSVDHRVYSCLVHDNNTSDGTTVQSSNNIGGVNVLTDGNYPTNVVKVYQCEIYNECHAIRHKHADDYNFEAYSNLIHDSESGFYNRNDGTNSLHHNLIYDVTDVCLFDAENSFSDKEMQFYNNTMARFTNIFSTKQAATFDINPFNFYKNIAYAPSQSGPVFILGALATSNYADFVVSYDNVIYLASDTTFFENNDTVTSLSTFKTNHSDTTTVSADPLFTDAVNDDFTLQAGSPAIALGAGAL